MAALAGKKALVKIPGVGLSFTDEATTSAGDGTNYQITSTTKRVWDSVASITVKVGGSVTGESYTLNRLTGTVTFAVVNLSRAAVTVSGTYLPLSTAVESRSYSYQLTAKNDPDNSFGDDWVTRVQTQKDVHGSLARWFVDTYFSDALLADTLLVFQFYSNSSNAADLTCWGRLSRRAISAIQSGLQEETLDFDGALDADSHAIDAVTVAPPPTELAFLRANIVGGDSTMTAVYLPDQQTTLSGSAVTTWADARGGGFGPSLTGAGSAQPTYDSVNNEIDFDGVDDLMATATSALFDLSGTVCIAMTGVIPTSAGSLTLIGIEDTTGASRLLGIGKTNAGGVIYATVLQSGSSIANSTVVTSNTARLIMVYKDASNQFYIQIPNDTEATWFGGGTQASGNNKLVLGINASPFSIRGLITLNRMPTAGDITTLKSWAQTYHGATLA